MYLIGFQSCSHYYHYLQSLNLIALTRYFGRYYYFRHCYSRYLAEVMNDTFHIVDQARVAKDKILDYMESFVVFVLLLGRAVVDSLWLLMLAHLIGVFQMELLMQ